MANRTKSKHEKFLGSKKITSIASAKRYILPKTTNLFFDVTASKENTLKTKKHKHSRQIAEIAAK